MLHAALFRPSPGGGDLGHTFRFRVLLEFFSRTCLLTTLFLVCTARAAPTALPSEAKEHPRQVLVLFGWNSAETDRPKMWAADTLTSELFQAPLEWLGYQTVYWDLGRKKLPEQLDRSFAAILIDGAIDVPPARQMDLADWLIRQQALGIKLLFTGNFPFSEPDALEKIHAALGISGSGRAVPHATDIQMATVDTALMNAEKPVRPQVDEFHDFRAPEKARLLMSLTAVDDEGNAVRSDPVFLASWGGVWLEPYIVFRSTEDHALFYADPYLVLSACLGSTNAFPAPDPTTRDGRRVFYSQIDGDGFPTSAKFGGHPLCSEVIRDQILKVYPLPVTVSFIEADLRAEVDGLETSDAARFQSVARSILALPNIRTASHSYSHPFIWFPGDPNPGIYDEVNVPLKPSALYPKILANREVKGSVEFINQTIAPSGKPVEVFLWSGNCRPGIEALRACRELDIENLNGGNTKISSLYPGLAGISPSLMTWDDELQVYSSNQNEFVYTSGFNGPFYGGFSKLIETFERTETPRRLKPVDVYYHFYSGQHLSSLQALEKIERWCMSHPLHGMTVRDFARTTRDSYFTKIYDCGPRHWMMTNAGYLRTYRLPASFGVPDLAKCQGITGWKIQGDQLYVHTDGSPIIDLQLANVPNSPAYLHIEESSADLTFITRTAGILDFEAEDFRPIEIVLAGLPAKTACDVTVNGKVSQSNADEHGHVALLLPSRAHVSVAAHLPKS